MKIIVLTGPESCGKSTLAKDLSEELGFPVVEEFARAYLDENGHDYDFDDVLKMAEGQLKTEQNTIQATNGKCILDTDLTVFSIWIEEAYQTKIDWIQSEIQKGKNKVYLLCDTDVKWTYDPQREHPDPADRKRLFKAYQNLLEEHGLNYHIVSGDRTDRLKKALNLFHNLK